MIIVFKLGFLYIVKVSFRFKYFFIYCLLFVPLSIYNDSLEVEVRETVDLFYIWYILHNGPPEDTDLKS